MKSIATLLGWIAIGAIVTIAGQHVWKQFKTDNPQRSEEISQNVRETIQKGAEAVKDTAQAVVEKTDAEDLEPEQTAATEAPVKESGSATDTVSAEASATDSAKGNEPVFPSLGRPKALDNKAVDTRTPAEKKEDAITERFYKLAADKPAAKPVVEAKKEAMESADDYQERQEVLSRQEDILLERQMRIVDELAGE